jgi:hypothetical protein
MATPYKKKDKAVIPLAKGFNKDKLSDNLIVMEKFDGIPLEFTMGEQGVIKGQTRTGKPTVSSVEHIIDRLGYYMRPGETVVMEVFLPNAPFKESSGHVRRDKPMEGLLGVIWDYWEADSSLDRNTDFGPRIIAARKRFARKGVLGDLGRPFNIVPFEFCTKESIGTAKILTRKFSETNPKLFEGFIIRDYTSKSVAGTRHWDYQKSLIEPTLDLFIWGCEEAIDKEGEPTGRTGALIVGNPFAYNVALCGIGSGKLSFEERKELFNRPKQVMHGLHKRPNAVWYRFNEPKIACIKYKKDPTYAAIRQGTFQHWRLDKEEESYD